MSTTNNGFTNNLASNLMVVSGESSEATYTARSFSDKVQDVIKVSFADGIKLVAVHQAAFVA